MCGRYAVRPDPAALAVEFEAIDRTGGELAPDYNVTPTRTVPIVVDRGERSVRPVRWGYVPTWAKDAGSGPPMINARAESVTTKPSFADAAAKRRCLMPATGWYEWRPGDRRRQPYLCAHAGGDSLAMAAVFSAWWPPDSRTPLVTCAVVTTEAVGPLAEVHHRMPLVLPRDRWADWLDPARTEIGGLLEPAAGMLDALEIRPVSTEVNAMRNNHPALLDRADEVPEPAEQAALFES
ncbi:SOS response-associated peptidase [Saccharopolyspora sp. CA-218241]|uniref:SOS response-associated peptidase n=1 Tax=Saccharopolyspora sp. CA-218241 TaxID=3240027 RepID=UPI003D989C0C